MRAPRTDAHCLELSEDHLSPWARALDFGPAQVTMGLLILDEGEKMVGVEQNKGCARCWPTTRACLLSAFATINSDLAVTKLVEPILRRLDSGTGTGCHLRSTRRQYPRLDRAGTSTSVIGRSTTQGGWRGSLTVYRWGPAVERPSKRWRRRHNLLRCHQ
ncbi:hypothetical protein KFL_003650020 [Klebsormidium nitens]|uniref:Uncharacterized protein n=1 Tax=Klebsormidium nitens TaxID=105231 RepID=A0A1Y1IEU7_KLENI|nr:hypothetical protein KFL_003650020 [Klebsormidium nitens]|eukprot:GAQ87611.1 hypothetical protein KFL_003650020 [Klebsormidium nitens]